MNVRFAEVRASRPLSNPVAAVAAPRAPQAASAAVRHVHRERDFGVGYGNSSGYGRERYTRNTFAPLFRCA